MRPWTYFTCNACNINKILLLLPFVYIVPKIIYLQLAMVIISNYYRFIYLFSFCSNCIFRFTLDTTETHRKETPLSSWMIISWRTSVWAVWKLRQNASHCKSDGCRGRPFSCAVLERHIPGKMVASASTKKEVRTVAGEAPQELYFLLWVSIGRE